MRVLGISGGFGHDAAAALVVDGRPLFALEEERPTRAKEAPWAVPTGAVRAALAVDGCSIHDVDALAVSWDPFLLRDEPRPGIFLDDVITTLHLELGGCPPVATLPHHLCHAAAGYYTSDFDAAAIVVVDDRGEDRSGSVFTALGDRIDETLRIPIRASLGAMFISATLHLGFGPQHAGKTMGLAAYGEPTHELPWLRLMPDGYELASDFVSGFGPDDALPDWSAVFAHAFGAAAPRGCRHRELEDIPDRHRNAAASAQEALQRVLLHLTEVATREAGSANLVLGGGVALNCTANGHLRRAPHVDDLHVFGAAGDAGAALGAALLLAVDGGDPRPGPVGSAALGQRFGADDVVDRARHLGLEVRWGDGAAHTAVAIDAGLIGGWFRGRDELGPRALGNRSIVARADNSAIAARVNRVKGRESWRPLAPALTPEAAGGAGIDEVDRGLDFMVEARWPSRPEGLDGVIHVDGSTRPLVVAAEEHAFRPLLAEWGERAGTAAVLNTSFNVSGEPLVHSPRDAFRLFCSSPLDFICIEDVFIAKPNRGRP